jgi:hypothetical protein
MTKIIESKLVITCLPTQLEKLKLRILLRYCYSDKNGKSSLTLSRILKDWAYYPSSSGGEN